MAPPVKFTIMIAPESDLHLLPWNELLSDIHFLMEKEKERIKANKEYYKSIYYKENQDKGKLNKLYDRIAEDQQRFDFFNELLVRLDQYNAVVLLNSMENCEKKEKEINGKIPEDWQIIIIKENRRFSVYYYPIN